jgi:hypothetical protein
MPLSGKGRGKITHCTKKSRQFLNMLGDKVGLLPHFHEAIYRVAANVLKPGMLNVELVAQYQAKRVGFFH